ncbi:MAG: HDOD domain-containing protein [Acidobacteriota bacterium]
MSETGLVSAALLTRRPLLGGDGEVRAHLLGSSQSPEDFFANRDPCSAAELIEIHGSGRTSFVEATVSALTDDVIAGLDAETTVLHFRKDEDELGPLLDTLRKRRIRTALDWGDGGRFPPGHLSRATFLTLDHHETDERSRDDCLQAANDHSLQVAALNIEAREDFERAKSNGCQLFSGFFPFRPIVREWKDIPASKIGMMRFFQEVNEEDLSFEELENVITREVALSLRLLSHLNTAAFNWSKEVTSIRQALILLGERPLKRWASTMAMLDLGDGQPPIVTETCLLRARLCEVLGKEVGLGMSELDLFFTGLLTGVDALVGRPMNDVLAEMDVRPEIREALLGESGMLGRVLELVMALELSDWSTLIDSCSTLGLGCWTVADAYRDALEWLGDFQ